MNKREERVINAFINCVHSGEFTMDYATTLIEDNQKYGWLSESAKEKFYKELEKSVVEQIAEPENKEPENKENTNAKAKKLVKKESK